jgi:hypothetical protein
MNSSKGDDGDGGEDSAKRYFLAIYKKARALRERLENEFKNKDYLIKGSNAIDR